MAARLIGAGARITVLDDLNDAHSTHRKRENLRQVSEQGSFDFLRVDIANTDELQSALCGKTYEILIHLAARTGVRSSLDCPLLYERVNLFEVFNLGSGNPISLKRMVQLIIDLLWIIGLGFPQ